MSLTDARPPAEVAPDFAAAQAAQSERDRRINEARTFAATTRAAAQAEAQARLDRARARPIAPSSWPGAAPAGSSPCWPRPIAPAP